MRRSSRFSIQAASLVLLLLVNRTIGSNLHSSSAQFQIIQQSSASAEAEVARWASQLKSSAEEERREAAMQLALIKSQVASATLASAIADPSPVVRAVVVAGLAEQGYVTVIPLLAERLAQDKNQFVRKTSAYALARFHGSERTLALIGALRAKDPEVRAAAAVSLGDHADNDAIAPLSEALSDKSDVVRAQAARAIGVNGRAATQTVPGLMELLSKDRDSEVKRQAAVALGKIGDRAALPALERARHDKDPYLERVAAEAIALIEKAVTIRRLTESRYRSR